MTHASVRRRLLFSNAHLIIRAFPATFAEPEESELNGILLIFRQRNIYELNPNRCSLRPHICRALPVVARPVQQKRGVRLYPQERADRYRLDLTIGLPDFHGFAFTTSLDVPLVHGFNQIEHMSIRSRAMQLHVFGMRPK